MGIVQSDIEEGKYSAVMSGKNDRIEVNFTKQIE
jgi:hypothetical protein